MPRRYGFLYLSRAAAATTGQLEIGPQIQVTQVCNPDGERFWPLLVGIAAQCGGVFALGTAGVNTLGYEQG